MTVPVAPLRPNASLAALLPFPAADTNKYRRGHLSLVAGSAAYPGAACLAADGATRAGAGYTEVFCAGKALLTVRGHRPSLVARDWRTWHPGRPSRGGSGDHPRACVIGCGFDTAEGGATAGLLMETLRAWEAPLLVDGGALGLLASPTGLRLAAERAAKGRPLVLTPHGGEAARLAAAASLAPDRDAPTLAAALARAYGATVALKGPRTYIADTRGKVEVMDRGMAALAKAGTGDVLAGIIGALLAQGLSPVDAAALGCALHAEAGRAAEAALSALCVTADDLADFLPAAVRALAAPAAADTHGQ